MISARKKATLGGLMVALWAFPTAAQIAVSVNDGKQLRAGDSPASRSPDTLAVIDLAPSRPRVIATIPVPNTLIGPPTSVAVAPDESIAIVTSAQSLDDGAPPALVLADTVSVVALANRRAPRVVQTLHAGPGASGVAINRSGTLVLVASTGDDSVVAYALARGRLKFESRVQLPYQSRPTDVAFLPDGKSALVVAQSAGKIIKLRVDGGRLTRTPMVFSPGLQPYGIVVAPRGDYAYNTNLGGRANGPAAGAGGKSGTVSVLDLTTGKVVADVETGAGPEHLNLSADGAYLAVTVGNGSNAPPGSPAAHGRGLVRVYRVEGPALSQVAEAETGQWCQGSAWTRDRRTLLLQCAGNRQIEVYRFDGASLARDEAATLTFAARPASIATAWSR